MNENQQLSVDNTAFNHFNSAADLMKMIISPFLLPVSGLPSFYTVVYWKHHPRTICMF